LEGGFVDLPSQIEAQDVSIDFERAVSGDHAIFKTRLEHKTYSIEEVAERMFQALKMIDDESKTSLDKKDWTAYAKKFPLEQCEGIVAASLKRMRITSGRVTEENRQKFLRALGTLRRKKAKRVVYKLNPKALMVVNTKERQAESCSAAELRRNDKTIFFGPGCEALLQDEQVEFFKEVQDEDGDFTGARVEVANSHDLKTPLNLVIADAGNERKFVRKLCDRENSEVIDCWIKNAPQRFYSIDYAWRKGEHPKRGEFSPDFFIKQGKTIYVVEVKEDEEIRDPSPENQKKCEYAVAHFDRLNKWLQKEHVAVHYQFNFLTPKSYGIFFENLRKKTLKGFRSELDVVLKSAGA
jgi:type III restriction enzyme